MSPDPTRMESSSSIAEDLELDDLARLALSEVHEREEQTETAEHDATADTAVKAKPAITAAPIAPPLPVTPIKILRRRVSGRYRSSGTGFQLELRVDVDGSRPTNRFSGDFFSTSGSTSTYFGSFIVAAPTISVTATQATIEGIGQFTWSTAYQKVKVTIPRTLIFSPPGSATVQFATPSGTAGASYLCPFVSAYFRTVQWEQDCVQGTVPFVSYNTGSLPQPATSPVRDLGVAKAYAEAGIEMQTAGTANIVNSSEAGPNAKWSDSELHAAMVNNFSLWANIPQWKVYLLVATAHEGGYRGIMFDYADAFQRQGCAVFFDAIKGTDAATQRAQLRTYVHELGHCFNLLHSWQKNLANPPAPLGPNGGLGDLSWMNYAWQYQPPPPAPGGEAAYWANFPFQFTDNEIAHLRHAFYRNIILGGNAFATGAAEIDPMLFADAVEDYSGLQLELRARSAFAFGEPVVVEIKLSTTDTRGRRVHTFLHPNTTMVQIAIRQPSGRTLLYRPMIEHCVDEERTTKLDPDQPAVYESAYIGYGKDGFYFEQPGAYQLRAIYVAPDGSRVVSPTLTIRVRSPHSAADEEVAELLMGDEQGKLLYLLGSDSDALKRGNEAFDELLAKHGKHPLAVYANLVKGINAERDYKRLAADRPEKTVSVRKAEAGESIQQLSSVAEASAGERGVDNITLNMVIRRIARAQKKAGDLDRAEATLDRMVETFKRKQLKPQVLRRISAQAETEKASLGLAGHSGESNNNGRRARRKH